MGWDRRSLALAAPHPRLDRLFRLESEVQLKCEVRADSPWKHPITGLVDAMASHVEIPTGLTRKVYRGLSVPECIR
jgi:hypothetical protein